MSEVSKPEIAYSDFLKLPEGDKAKYAEHFAKLNETPVFKAEERLKARWQEMRERPCKECEGQGFYEFTGNNPNRHAAIECLECDGDGYTEVPYLDFIDSLPDTDPDLIQAGRV